MRAIAPGRVNLIGDHTDYTGGLVFPMAINRHTVIDARFTEDPSISLTSADEPDVANFAIPVSDISSLQPQWARYIAAVAAECNAARGIVGTVATDIPIGSGLSSSAALEVATALALGFDGSAQELAQLAQRAEHLATGVPTGIMDQLCISLAEEHHAMLIDCSTLEVVHIPIPQECKVVVRFVTHRTLQGSEYGERVHQCNSAESIIGPLRLASIDMLELIEDATISMRARHVINENQRVRDFAHALASNDLQHAGRLMNEGHASLARDFATSTSVMDAAVDEIQKIPGVFGARMTGGGFGGCVVALCSHDADVPGWTVSAVGAARLA
ncbi:MAG: galactokinase [Actinobacteria bacterium]|nr:galactokinase [Actinomycetota bacterium]MDA2951914.1 galactokinase [Actinomycetota bacterium]